MPKKKTDQVGADSELDLTLGGSNEAGPANFGPGNRNAARSNAIKPTPRDNPSPADEAIERGEAESAALMAACAKLAKTNPHAQKGKGYK